MKIQPGVCVVVSLHSPREKIWGVLTLLDATGIQIRGLDINTVEDWIRTVINKENDIVLSNSFMPMWRVERISLDESFGEIISLEEQFEIRTGISLFEYLNHNEDLIA